MSLRRLQLDLAVTEVDGKLPPAIEGQWIALLSHIRAFKDFSVRINDGMANEEETTKATWHVCRHDETGNKPCETIEI